MLNFTDQFEVRSLGIQECDVYDIEVEDNHNFFANDILVHNSIYINLGPLVEQVFGTVDISREKGESFIDRVCEQKIEPLLTEAYAHLAETMGAQRNAMVMKREKIADKAIFCLHPDTMVFDGRVTIEQAYNKKTFGQLVSYDPSNMEIEPDLCVGANRKLFDGEMVVIETPSGNTIKLTPDHMVLVKDGRSCTWKRADRLVETDELVES